MGRHLLPADRPAGGVDRGAPAGILARRRHALDGRTAGAGGRTAAQGPDRARLRRRLLRLRPRRSVHRRPSGALPPQSHHPVRGEAAARSRPQHLAARPGAGRRRAARSPVVPRRSVTMTSHVQDQPTRQRDADRPGAPAVGSAAGATPGQDFTRLPDLASRSLGGSVVHANDELFAERENLIKPEEPSYSTYTFGHKGQVYDGWETRRRREPGFDYAIVRLG